MKYKPKYGKAKYMVLHFSVDFVMNPWIVYCETLKKAKSYLKRDGFREADKVYIVKIEDKRIVVNNRLSKT